MERSRNTESELEYDVHPAWWNEQYNSDWDRVKEALKRDWEQTKWDLGASTGRDLRQTALDTLKQALAIDPAHPTARNALAWVWYRKGGEENAIEAQTRLLSLWEASLNTMRESVTSFSQTQQKAWEGWMNCARKSAETVSSTVSGAKA